MPQISSFFGIVISMYWNEGPHQTPHFHAEFGGHAASVGFDGTILAGNLPARAGRLVREWAALHGDELMRNWEQARERKPLEAIDPLT